MLDGSPWTITSMDVGREIVSIELDHAHGVAVERGYPVRIIERSSG
jgi:hypothetical protein